MEKQPALRNLGKAEYKFGDVRICRLECTISFCKIRVHKKKLKRQKKFPSRQKKLPSRQKKYPYGLEDFVRVFGKLTTPSVIFIKQKTQILIAHQKEGVDRTQKSFLKVPMV